MIVVIHWSRTGYLNFDVLYKPSLLDRLLRRKPVAKGFCEYEATECPVVRKYMAMGWRLLCSGDTAHAEELLRDLGIRHEKDLKGLKNYLQRLYPGAEIIIEDVVA